VRRRARVDSPVPVVEGTQASSTCRTGELVPCAKTLLRESFTPIIVLPYNRFCRWAVAYRADVSTAKLSCGHEKRKLSHASATPIIVYPEGIMLTDSVVEYAPRVEIGLRFRHDRATSQQPKRASSLQLPGSLQWIGPAVGRCGHLRQRDR
jgi:hypothetical protein